MEKVTVAWADDSQKVLVCTYQGEWTWEDFYEALKRQYRMIESSSAPSSTVDILVDVRGSNWMPKGGSLMSGINKVKTQQHPRQGETIIVGAKGMVAAIADVASKVLRSSRKAMHFAKTMEDAQILLAQFASRREAERLPRS
jgi:hypothetical protein